MKEVFIVGKLISLPKPILNKSDRELECILLLKPFSIFRLEKNNKVYSVKVKSNLLSIFFKHTNVNDIFYIYGKRYENNIIHSSHFFKIAK